MFTMLNKLTFSISIILGKYIIETSVVGQINANRGFFNWINRQTVTLTTIANASRVLELSDRFLEVKHEGQWFVMFYAPWCAHCKRTEPIWGHVAQSLSNTNVRVGRIDVSRFTAVGQHFKINSYPTIML